MLTLIGPPGVGKTRLAAEAVRSRPDSWFLRLENVRDVEFFVYVQDPTATKPSPVLAAIRS